MTFNVLLFETYASTSSLIVLNESDPAMATPAASIKPAPTPTAPPIVSVVIVAVSLAFSVNPPALVTVEPLMYAWI